MPAPSAKGLSFTAGWPLSSIGSIYKEGNVEAKKVEQSRNQMEGGIKRWQYGLIGLGLTLIASYLIYFGMILGQMPAEDAEKWGQFGDFIGGVLNPIVAFAAFYWLTQSVKIQKLELFETKQALQDAAKAQKETADAQKEAVYQQKETAKAQMEAAQAQQQSAKCSALLLRASIHEALMRYELEEKRNSQDFIHEVFDDYMKQGASWETACELIKVDLPEMNTKTRKHHEIMQKHLNELNALLDSVISPPEDRH